MPDSVVIFDLWTLQQKHLANNAAAETQQTNTNKVARTVDSQLCLSNTVSPDSVVVVDFGTLQEKCHAGNGAAALSIQAQTSLLGHFTAGYACPAQSSLTV